MSIIVEDPRSRAMSGEELATHRRRKRRAVTLYLVPAGTATEDRCREDDEEEMTGRWHGVTDDGYERR